mmetsp:Transcript_20376/g.59103  ORF Transcript_20376/g.59103 Transcript_20376/m.59103 type:complete len:215 (+) Transcript_20376:660-1304(+)
MLSTMLVKPAMSEKKSVTSRSSTPGFASTPACSSSCTTGQGTYLPQDLIAFFMLSKMRWICRISAVPPRSGSPFSSERPASCSCTMLCISSARALRGFSRLLERKARSFVSSTIPSRMMTITRMVVRTDMRASCLIMLCPSSTATVSVRLLRSSPETSASDRSGRRRRTRSVQRWGELRSSSSTSSSRPRRAQVRAPSSSCAAQRWPRRANSLQ